MGWSRWAQGRRVQPQPPATRSPAGKGKRGARVLGSTERSGLWGELVRVSGVLLDGGGWLHGPPPAQGTPDSRWLQPSYGNAETRSAGWGGRGFVSRRPRRVSAFLPAELWAGPCCLHATSSADPLRHGRGTGEQPPAPTAQPPPSVVPPGGADLLGVSIASAAALQPPRGLWVRGVGAAGRAALPPPVPSCSQGTVPGAVPNSQHPSPSIRDALATGTQFGTRGCFHGGPALTAVGLPDFRSRLGVLGRSKPPGWDMAEGAAAP